MNNIYTVCHDSLDVFEDKEKAKDFYSLCYQSSEGAERERYGSILVDLNFTDKGTDKITKDCKEIYMFVGDNYQKQPLLYILKNWETIEETISIYEKKLKSIVEVSNEYDLNFNDGIPFQYYGADSDSYNMISFSDYYKDILDKEGIKIDNIITNTRSDGKYNLIINDDLSIDIRAWDDFTSVVDNVELILDYYKSKDLER